MEKIYVLRCNHGKYYVGKTSNIDRRLAEHFGGQWGSEWTRYHRAQEILEVENMNSPLDEANKTLEYMRNFGIDNVRGAQWSNIQLTLAQRTEILKMLNPNGCYRCGEIGHFANNCTRRNQSSRTGQCYTCGNHGHFSHECRFIKTYCQRCGRDNHSENDCYATYDINHDMLGCSRCGRNSHSIDRCFAKVDIHGRRLY